MKKTCWFKQSKEDGPVPIRFIRPTRPLGFDHPAKRRRYRLPTHLYLVRVVSSTKGSHGSVHLTSHRTSAV